MTIAHIMYMYMMKELAGKEESYILVKNVFSEAGINGYSKRGYFEFGKAVAVMNTKGYKVDEMKYNSDDDIVSIHFIATESRNEYTGLSILQKSILL